MSGGMSRGRINPVDLELERAKGMPPNGAHVDADRDYVTNGKKFERHDDMAAEPNRNNAPPKQR